MNAEDSNNVQEQKFQIEDAIKKNTQYYILFISLLFQMLYQQYYTIF